MRRRQNLPLQARHRRGAALPRAAALAVPASAALLARAADEPLLHRLVRPAPPRSPPRMCIAASLLCSIIKCIILYDTMFWVRALLACPPALHPLCAPDALHLRSATLASLAKSSVTTPAGLCSTCTTTRTLGRMQLAELSCSLRWCVRALGPTRAPLRPITIHPRRLDS